MRNHGRQRSSGTRMRRGRRFFSLEALEPRRLLAASPIISEFLASNQGGLRDGDGNTSDWIEIFNAGDESVDLAGYRLTDRADQLSKWTFPSTLLQAGEYLVVFASGREGTGALDSQGHLHTNFTLKREGEYLALVSPSGTIVSKFGSSSENFPEQIPNVSYGIAQSLTLLDARSDMWYVVPTGDAGGSTWTLPDFDAAGHGFTAGKASLGLESRPNDRVNFTGQFDTVLPAGTHGAYLRMEFQVHDASAIGNLLLRLKYDNGFVAYLNGVKVASANAPESLGWFASATDGSRRDADALQFADFDLSGHTGELLDGKNVLAIHVMNNLADNSDLLLVPELRAGARDLLAATGTAARSGFMTSLSPGGPNVGNNEVYLGLVQDTKFSVPRGFYDSPQQVEITTGTEGATIYYSIDGSEPSPTSPSSQRYTAAIPITTTTVLRAAAFKDGFLPANVDTQTYIYVADVIHQGNSPPGYPSQWLGDGGSGTMPADYEMDPEITEHPAYRDTIDDALLAIPTVSIVTDIDNLFDPLKGIYQRSDYHGNAWERPASVELIYPDGTQGFQENVGLRIHGGHTRSPSGSPKHSFRLRFRSEYGAGALQYDWFGGSSVDEFDTIVLRAGGNQSWIHTNTFMGDNRGRAQYVRDQWGKDTLLAMGRVATHNDYAHLYINGLYWGLYNPTERPTAAFAASYLGGRPEDYDVLNAGVVLDGDNVAWRELERRSRADLAVEANYQAISEILDIDAFIDYMILNQYGGNTDWDSHNWYAIYPRRPEGKFIFVPWDTEFIFINLNDNVLRVADGMPGRLFRGLQNNEEFRVKLADQIQRHLFNDGLLTPASVVERWEARSNQIVDAIVAESARWGDYRRDVVRRDGPYALMERDVHWMAERNRLLNDYFPVRTGIVLEQYRQRNLFPSIDAPQLNQHGGLVSRDFEVRLAADQGTIYFTTNGTDPRLTGAAVSGAASIFAAPLVITKDTTVKARALHDGQWSALTEANFVVASDLPLRITEINYNPHQANRVPGMTEAEVDNDGFEFIELMNVGDGSINLKGVQLARSTVRGDRQGVTFNFAAQAVAAGERIVVARDREAFQSRYGKSVRIAAGNDGAGGDEGEYAGRLSDVGEQLTLTDATGKVIQQFAYKTFGAWPTRANGAGSSLEMVDPTANVADPANWRSSREFGGSPGAAGAAASRVVINEILANTASPDMDAIELFNNGPGDVNVTNWYVSDTPENYFKGRVTAAKTVPAYGYVVLTAAEMGLDLDGIRGGEILLMSADASGRPLQFVDRVEFGSADRGVSLGRWPTGADPFIPLDRTTFGGPNAGPEVPDVIISEIYFNPLVPGNSGLIQPRDLEFIEVTNVTDRPVDLTGWQLAGQVRYAFPEGATLGANKSMVILTFDPTAATGRTKAEVFKITLGMSPADEVFGVLTDPHNSRSRDVVRDDGALVKLVRPGLPSPEDPNAIPMLVVDQVNYLPTSPWPGGTARGGKSLTRVGGQDYGLFATSWVAANPSPGTAQFFERIAGDANDDGKFDQLDVTLALLSGKYRTGEPARWLEGDWTGDGVFDQLDLVAALQTGNYGQGSLAARTLAETVVAAGAQGLSVSAVDAVLQGRGGK